MEDQRIESQAELTDPAQPAGSALPARIAILEGGGMRGCITAHFLLELEQRARCPLWQLFDLVVGTSTGGILAALIVSGVPAAKMVDFYQVDGPKIFKRSPWWTLKTLGSAIGSKYNNRALIECIQARIPITVGEAKTNFMVPTWDGNADENIFIKSFDRQEFWNDFPLAFAAIATASAPTYFQGFVPKKYGQPEKYDLYDSRFFDGGFTENNPVTCTLHEIYTDFPKPQKFQRKPRVIVNFGTGSVVAKSEAAPNGGLLPWATEVYKRMSALQNKLSERTSRHMFGDGMYIRIDAELDETIEIDDVRPRTLRKMEAVARQAIEKHEDGKPKIDFDSLVRLLKI
jgi:hypothetical protein